MASGDKIEALADQFEAALVGRDRSAFAACCALDVHFEDPLSPVPLRGIDQLADHAAQLWVGFPDARIERSGQRLADGRFGVLPVRMTGTHAGEVADLPPTHRKVSLHALLYVELDPPRERLWRVRAFFDLYAVAVQLGVLPERGGVGERALMMLRGFGLRRG